MAPTEATVDAATALAVAAAADAVRGLLEVDSRSQPAMTS